MRFCAILKRQPFSSSLRARYYPGPPGSAHFIIFMCDHFQYSLFGLNMIPAQFRAILRRQPFSSSLSRTLISQPSRDCSFYNFRVQPLPIFVIWPKYATHAIWCDSETATFVVRAIANVNIPALLRALL